MKRYQFRLRSLLFGSVVLGFVLSVALQHWALLTTHLLTAVRFGVVLLAGILGRQIPMVFRSRLGAVGNHAVAWFGCFVTTAMAVCILHALDRPNRWRMDFADGVAALSLVCGIIVATALEVGALFFRGLNKQTH